MGKVSRPQPWCEGLTHRRSLVYLCYWRLLESLVRLPCRVLQLLQRRVAGLVGI